MFFSSVLLVFVLLVCYVSVIMIDHTFFHWPVYFISFNVTYYIYIYPQPYALAAACWVLFQCKNVMEEHGFEFPSNGRL
jgi:hypothetical protein